MEIIYSLMRILSAILSIYMSYRCVKEKNADGVTGWTIAIIYMISYFGVSH